MNNYTIKTEQDRIIELMSWLLEIDKNSQDRMTEIIREIGIKTFFQELEYLDLSDEVKVKMSNLKNVLDALSADLVDSETQVIQRNNKVRTKED